MQSEFRMRKGCAVAFIGLAAVLFGCDSSGSGAGPGNGTAHNGRLDACGLLTLADASAAIGRTVDTAKADTLLYMNSCYYKAKPDSGSFFSPHLFIQGWTTWSLQHSGSAPATLTATEHFANLKKGAIDSGAVAVAGVGDGAFWWKRFGQFWFLSGDVEASIMVNSTGKMSDTSDAAEEAARQAALKAISRL